MKLKIFSNKTTRIINLSSSFFTDQTIFIRGKPTVLTPISKAKSLADDLCFNAGLKLKGCVLEKDEEIIYDSFKQENRGTTKSNLNGAKKLTLTKKMAWHKTVGPLANMSHPQSESRKFNFRGPLSS
jgi:hypothetical protein